MIGRRASSVALVALALAACASPVPRNPVPPDLANDAAPPGFEAVRLWGDFNDRAAVERMMTTRATYLRKKYGVAARNGRTPRLKYLALSGGGQYGAFSAGVLTAWTKSGKRPRFDGVTGISTGAIIAPFAFLGPAYDHVLTEVYTTTTTADMIEPTVFSGVLTGSSLADTAPLRAKIAQYVTQDLLDAIAVEHEKGRLLYVGTTNIDVGRSVVWDMGAIAASGRPEALQLFRDVILASAAIPIAFPPVFFDVEAKGKRYREMHVDGGVTSQVTVLSPQMPNYLMKKLVGFNIERELYVIVNGAVTPPPKAVEPRLHRIGSATIGTMWYSQTIGDLYKIHAIVERDKVDVHYAWIPDAFDDEPMEQFDPDFMRRLYALAQNLFAGDTLWRDYPPNYTARGSTDIERSKSSTPTDRK
ncbi:MAG: patatin-like phospholipase family protein [Pseudomonadota bacterium]